MSIPTFPILEHEVISQHLKSFKLSKWDTSFRKSSVNMKKPIEIPLSLFSIGLSASSHKKGGFASF